MNTTESSPDTTNAPQVAPDAANKEPIAEIRATLEATVDRWCPKTNPNGGPTPPFEQRMANALLHINAFEIDYRRVMAGGKPLRSGYPLPLPSKEKETITT
jgi:hypothetical protein